MAEPSHIYERIYALVRQIPVGNVMTYGEVGRQVGGCSGRVVGFALAALAWHPTEEVPWQRVINAKGKISPHGFDGLEQRVRLEEEGVVFDADNRVDLEKFGWDGCDTDGTFHLA